jgi:hypothetical protein
VNGSRTVSEMWTVSNLRSSTRRTRSATSESCVSAGGK